MKIVSCWTTPYFQTQHLAQITNEPYKWLNVVDFKGFYELDHQLDTVEVIGSSLKQNHLSSNFALVQSVKALVYFFQLDGIAK